MNSYFGYTPWILYPGYRQWLKLGDVSRPANFWILIEEHPDSINDGVMINNPAGSASWTDLPGSLHDGGAAISYADGRAEIHKWLGSATRLPVRFAFAPLVLDPQSQADFQWLMSRATVPN